MRRGKIQKNRRNPVAARRRLLFSQQRPCTGDIYLFFISAYKGDNNDSYKGDLNGSY